MKYCHQCGTEWVSEKKQPAIKETCPKCNAYLHCCLNCRFYAPHAHNKCQIPTTDWVADRSGPAFCDEFTFKETGNVRVQGSNEKTARDEFNTLFGEVDDIPDQGKDAFNKLFGD